MSSVNVVSSLAVPPAPYSDKLCTAVVSEKVQSMDSTILDGGCLSIGSTSDVTAMKKIVMRVQSAGVVPASNVLKVVDTGGAASVTPLLSGDADETPVIGISNNATTAAGQDVVVVVGGIFSVVVEDGDTISIGDAIKKSTAEDGRVMSDTSSVGTFGIALTSGTGDTAGTVTILAVFIKNENF